MSTVEFESGEWKAIETYSVAAIEKEAASGFDSLDEAERIAFCLWVADGEVGNGGMHAVCYNSTGDYLPHIPNAFRAIGAIRKAALFEDLALVFGQGGPSTDLELRNEQHESLSEASSARIEGLTDEYFEAPEEVFDLLFSYLRKMGKVFA
jgi:hypothetical protein